MKIPPFVFNEADSEERKHLLASVWWEIASHVGATLVIEDWDSATFDISVSPLTRDGAIERDNIARNAVGHPHITTKKLHQQRFGALIPGRFKDGVKTNIAMYVTRFAARGPQGIEYSAAHLHLIHPESEIGKVSTPNREDGYVARIFDHEVAGSHACFVLYNSRDPQAAEDGLKARYKAAIELARYLPPFKLFIDLYRKTLKTKPLEPDLIAHAIDTEGYELGFDHEACSGYTLARHKDAPQQS